MATASIVIATYNRATLLDECLTHVACQRFDPGDEVIVVDNGSTDATPDVLARHAHHFPVRLVHLNECRAGKSYALATGLANARGDIWAFTDDDVNVGPDWLAALRESLENRTAALAGGPVAPRWERHAPRWLRGATAELVRLGAPLALLDYGPAPSRLGARTLLGANMAIRRDVMERVGGFSLQLGKLRGTLLSGEDHDLCDRVQAAGYAALYVPRAIVYHWVPRERMRLRYFLSWFFWSGITHATFESERTRSGRSLIDVPLYVWRRGAVGLATAAAALLSGRREVAVDRMLDLAFAAGYASGRWRLVSVPLGRASRLNRSGAPQTDSAGLP